MKLKLLFICAVLCSVFATEDPSISFARRFATRVADIVFRHHPELEIEREEFIRNYPANAELEDIRIGKAMYDRGLNLSTQEEFFLDALTHVARLVDVARHAGKGQKAVVADIGCGNGETSIIFSLVGAITLGVEKYMSVKENTALGRRYAYAQELAINLGVDFNCALKCSLDAKELLVAEEDGEKFVHPDTYDVIFAGNFLNYNYPDESQSLIEEIFYTMLKPDGKIFASGDGVALPTNDPKQINNARDIYLSQKKSGAPFPTVLSLSYTGTAKETGKTKFLDFRDSPAMFLPCKTDKTGKPAEPIRQINITYRGDLSEHTEVSVARTRNLCFFDDALIEYLFRGRYWFLEVNKLNCLKGIDNTLPDNRVAKYNLIATKGASKGVSKAGRGSCLPWWLGWLPGCSRR